MITRNSTTVKMENGVIEASVSWDGVKVEDVQAYSPRLIAAMDLEDAVTLAKAILAFAEPTPKVAPASFPTEDEMIAEALELGFTDDDLPDFWANEPGYSNFATGPVWA